MFVVLLLFSVIWLAFADSISGCQVGYGMVCRDMIFKEGDIIPAEKTTDDDDTTQLVLVNATGAIDENIFKNFPEVTIVSIINSDLKKFEPNWNLEKLRIQDTKLPRLTSEYWKRFNNLTELALIHITGEFGGFKYLKELESLTINLEGMVHFTKDMFEGLENLEDLILGENTITIHENAFEDLEELHFLKIKSNDTISFKPQTFKSLKKLTDLSLVGCTELEDIDWKIFSELKKLSTIGIPTKILESLDVTALTSNLPQLRKVEIYFKNKELEVIPSLQNVLLEHHVAIGLTADFF